MITDGRYAVGVGLFQDGFYFEAHEVLELAWRAHAPGPEKRYLQGLIQLAVCLEHWRRGNPRGARGQLAKAREKLSDLPDVFEGLRLRELLEAYARWEVATGLDGGPGGGESPLPLPTWAIDPPGSR